LHVEKINKKTKQKAEKQRDGNREERPEERATGYLLAFAQLVKTKDKCNRQIDV